MQRAWQVGRGMTTVRNGPVETVEELKEMLFEQRGITEESGNVFLEPDYERDILDPYVLVDMKQAVERIREAVSLDQHVMVYGDYDADGISSVAIVVSALREVGARVVPFLPHRLEHGYGLNQKVLEEVATDIDLLISVDCGVSNGAEIGWLKQQGVDTIVVDHHTLPDELPPVVALLHPERAQLAYEGAGLCGAGVSWKLASALLQGGQKSRGLERGLLDLACLGTVADMVPLLGENRVLVQFGLELLRRSGRPGIRALKEVALRGEARGLNTDDVAFRMAPLLNAAGRMDHPQTALDLLMSETEEEAGQHLAVLQRYNQQRRTVSQQIQREVEEMTVEVSDPVVFAYNHAWPPGVVGLVAGRLSDKFARPAVVIGGKGDSEAVGSARAPAGMDLMTILGEGENHLQRFGGHAGAAGFSIAPEHIAAFQAAVLEGFPADGRYEQTRSREADVEVAPALLEWETVRLIERLAPYGEGNPKPLMVLRRVSLLDWRAVGKAADHAKLTFRAGEEVYGGIGFGLVADLTEQGLTGGETVDVLFHLEVNEYRGRAELQLNVLDLARAGEADVVSS